LIYLIFNDLTHLIFANQFCLGIKKTNSILKNSDLKNSELLAQLAPKTLAQVLETYIRVWALQLDAPLISLYMSHSGQALKGEIVHIDTEAARLVLHIEDADERLDVAFLPFSQIQYFILHDLEKYATFVVELAKA
jgi:hypothetical protein